MKTFEVKYYRSDKPPVFSHSYVETWETVPEYHCPGCGKKTVWHNTEPGDYYVEEQCMCVTCGATFYLPGGINIINPLDTPLDTDAQRLISLRTKNV